MAPVISRHSEREIGDVTNAIGEVRKDGIVDVEEGRDVRPGAGVHRGHAVRRGLPVAYMMADRGLRAGGSVFDDPFIAS